MTLRDVKIIHRFLTRRGDAAQGAALPREVLEPRLYATAVCAQDIRPMLRSPESCALQSRNQQVVFMDDFIKNECGITVTADAVGAAFMIEGSNLREIRSKAQNKPKAAHHPLALTEDEESAAIRLIRDGYSSGNHVTQRDVLNFVQSQFQKCLTYRWVEYFLQQHADIVCKKTLAPQENPPPQVPKQFLDDYEKLIKKYVPLVPTELIFNIDECGFSDWEERRPKPVVIHA